MTGSDKNLLMLAAAVIGYLWWSKSSANPNANASVNANMGGTDFGITSNTAGSNSWN